MSEVLGRGRINMTLETAQGEVVGVASFSFEGEFEFIPKSNEDKQKDAREGNLAPFSTRIPIKLRRTVIVHAYDRGEHLQEFVDRALNCQLDREKDREVVYTNTGMIQPVEQPRVITARIDASIHPAIRKHVVKHCESVQAFANHAFTEQMKIDDVMD